MARTRTSGGGETVVGRSTRVHGRLSGDGDVRVEGSVEGDITLRGSLTIHEGGRATSNVDAVDVTIGCELEGDIRAGGAVRLEAGSRVRGDITCDAVAIDEGAEFAGALHSQFDLPEELREGARR